MANRPTQKHRFYGVEVAVWDGEKGQTYKVSRSYKDKDGQWHTTEYLGYRDLMALYVLIGRILSQPEEQAKPAEVQERATDPGYPADYDDGY